MNTSWPKSGHHYEQFQGLTQRSIGTAGSPTVLILESVQTLEDKQEPITSNTRENEDVK